MQYAENAGEPAVLKQAQVDDLGHAAHVPLGAAIQGLPPARGAALASSRPQAAFNGTFYAAADVQFDELRKLIDQVDDNVVLAKLAVDTASSAGWPARRSRSGAATEADLPEQLQGLARRSTPSPPGRGGEKKKGRRPVVAANVRLPRESRGHPGPANARGLPVGRLIRRYRAALVNPSALP